MDERGWERLAATTGLIFVMLSVLAGFLPGSPLSGSAATEEIRNYFVEHRTALLWQGLLFTGAGIFFVWWLGSLRAFLRRAEGGGGRLSAVAFGGGVAAAGAAVVLIAGDTALAYRSANSLEPGALVFVRDASLIGIAYLGSLVSVLIAAATLVGWRTGGLPKWVALVGAGAIVVNLVGAFAAFTTTGALRPGGKSSLVPLLALDVWIVAVSVVMLQKLGGGEKT